MRIRLLDARDRAPLVGLTVVLSQPFEEIPTREQFRRLGRDQVGRTNQKGDAKVEIPEISGPVQLTIMASEGERPEILARRVFKEGAELPAELELEIDPDADEGGKRGGRVPASDRPAGRDGPGAIGRPTGPGLVRPGDVAGDVERPRSPGADVDPPREPRPGIRPEPEAPREPGKPLEGGGKGDAERPRAPGAEIDPPREPRPNIRPDPETPLEPGKPLLGGGPGERDRIPLGPLPAPTTPIPDLGGFAKRTHRVTRGAGLSLQEGLRDKLERDQRTRADASVFADRLLSTPNNPLRAGGTLLRQPADLAPALKKQQDDGIARVRATGKRARGIVLRGRDRGIIDSDVRLRLSALARALSNTALSGRITRHSTPPQLVLREKPGLRAQPGGRAPEARPAAAAKSEEILSEIAQRVAEQTSGNRADYTSIEASLNNSLAAGPADQPAYYDLPVLHVAWKDVWEQAFDDKTRKEIQELYSSIVEVVPPEFIPSGDVAEVSELTDMLFDLGGVVNSATAAIALPSELADFVEGIEEVWPILSLNDQEYLRCLFHVHEFCKENFWRKSDLILRNYKNKSGKDDAKNKFFYAFYASYSNSNERAYNVSRDYDSGDLSYGYGKPVVEGSPEDDHLSVAFIRYIDRTAQYLLEDFHSEFGAIPQAGCPARASTQSTMMRLPRGSRRDLSNPCETARAGNEKTKARRRSAGRPR